MNETHRTPATTDAETKHTPGEWKASGNGVHKGMNCIAVAFDPEARETTVTEVAKANARLIAAAPDLYDAATYAMRVFSAFNESALHSLGMDNAVEGLRAAISKAEGQQ